MNDTENISLSKENRDPQKKLHSKANPDLAEHEAIAPTAAKELATKASKEIGGPKGLEPTRYGDWEAKGRCYDF